LVVGHWLLVIGYWLLGGASGLLLCLVVDFFWLAATNVAGDWWLAAGWRWVNIADGRITGGKVAGTYRRG
jgi:hypothetical protein